MNIFLKTAVGCCIVLHYPSEAGNYASDSFLGQEMAGIMAQNTRLILRHLSCLTSVLLAHSSCACLTSGFALMQLYDVVCHNYAAKSHCSSVKRQHTRVQ